LVIYGVFRAFGRIWLEHSIRLALLEKIEAKPQLLDSFHELLELMTGTSAQPRVTTRQDYRVTGAALGVIGAVSCVLGRTVSTGQIAVGIYVGGFICLGLAVLLLLVGFLIQWLARDPVLLLKKK
jgi:uncharacterized protein (TIGR04206 family)